MEDGCFPLDKLAGVELVDLFFPESLSSSFAGLFLREYLKSILRMLEDD